MADDKQSINEVLVRKITEASTLSATKFTQACQIGILFWGGQPTVYNPDKGIDNYPPYLPSRQSVRETYIKGLASMTVLQDIELQKAEELGIITALSKDIRGQWTLEKLARIIKECYEKNLLSSDMVVRTEKSFEVAEGMYRRPF